MENVTIGAEHRNIYFNLKIPVPVAANRLIINILVL